MAPDRGCGRDMVHGMNERYRAWVELKVFRAIEDWE